MSDIEQRVVAALEPMNLSPLAEDFLAALAAAGLVVTTKERAEVGEAVERLEATGLDWRIARDVRYEPHYSVTVYSDSAMADDLNADGPTILAAIDAALRGEP